MLIQVEVRSPEQSFWPLNTAVELLWEQWSIGSTNRVSANRVVLRIETITYSATNKVDRVCGDTAMSISRSSIAEFIFSRA